MDEIEVSLHKRNYTDIDLSLPNNPIGDVAFESQLKLVMPKAHNELLGLDYEHSGHTGFASTEQLNVVKRTTAKHDALGMVKVGENLNVTEYGTLSVDITDKAEDGNNKPVTSHAVHTIVGNIDKLLEII